VINPNGSTCAVTITGGTVTVISVNGTATGLTSGTVVVPVAGTIAITYSVAPTWTWAPYGASISPPSEMGVGYSVKFIKGTTIYADSTAGSSVAQLLYQAIGAANLRAYVQGQDELGHAGLAN
jgi:hypothetical protein